MKNNKDKYCSDFGNDEDVLLTLQKTKSKAIINSDEVLTGEFTRNPDLSIPSDKIQKNFMDIIGKNNVNFIPTAKIVKKILGEDIPSNMFVVGYAYQAGLIPIKASSIEQAIKLNNVSVDFNLGAFRLGRQTFLKKDNIYKLILGSLDKALPDAKESFREVVADGIAKKITKHMSGEE